MPPRLTLLSIALLAAFAAQSIHADDAGLRRCRALADSGARLACYDALPLEKQPPPRAAAAVAPTRPAAPAAPSAPPKATPEALEARFGIEPKVAAQEELAAIHSHIPGLFEGWRPNARIRLANGQVWQVADETSRMMERQDPKVSVRRGALGAFFLDIEGDNRSPRVRRVQ